jgi:hypothetical protein
MIKTKEGRSMSTRTPEEDLKFLEDAIEGLNPDERECLDIMLAEMQQSQGGMSDLLDAFGDVEYKHRPVDMETFVKDDYFLGKTCDNLRPRLMDDLKEMFESGYYNEVIYTGSIGWGKTFTASIAVCRIIYELSCMKDPHRAYGIAADSNISIVGLSVSEEIATKVVFENIATKIDASPYFKEHFPYERTKKEMRFPGHIWVAARATTTNAALGLNVVAALIDEGNFLAKGSDPRFEAVDKAEILYNGLKRRLKSRFQELGRLPGAIFIISSKMTSEDFTAKRIEASTNDPHVFVRDYALWEVMPEDTYCGDNFFVLVGNEQTPSKILSDDEVEKFKNHKPEGCVLIEAPVEFRVDFDADLEGAIRDIAGIATVSVSPYIQRREKIDEAIDLTRSHPFSELVYDSSKGGRFLWDQMVRPRLERGDVGGMLERDRPILNPNAPRHIHIDAALRNDSLGFSMTHIGGWKDVSRRNEDGDVFTERAPVYVADLLLQVVPPPGDEIILADVRQLIYNLSDRGYVITKVTMDQFQSADMLQTMAKKGYNAELLSVDRTTDAYDNLKTALYEGRMNYYEYPPLLKELRELELRFLGNSSAHRKKRKVDHPQMGSKDIADALAGSCYTLAFNQESMPMPMMSSKPGGSDAWLLEQKQSHAAGNEGATDNKTVKDFEMLPPFLMGDGDDWSGGGGGGWNDL